MPCKVRMGYRKLLNRPAAVTAEDVARDFAILARLQAKMAAPEPPKCARVSEAEGVTHRSGCTFWSDEGFERDEAKGCYVCTGCGVISVCQVIDRMPDRFDFMYRSNSYRRIHHWNERIGQFLCLESPTPRDVMHDLKLWFAERRLVPCKTNIRQALHQMRQSRYVEKWIAIQCELTGQPPPSPPHESVEQMRFFFNLIEQAFNVYKPKGRKSMLNYNFLFVRVLQYLDEPRYFRFFPLLKSKNKIRAIDACWRNMAAWMGWRYIPLPSSKLFR